VRAAVSDAVQDDVRADDHDEELARVHTREHIAYIRSRGPGWIDGDTYMNARSLEAALLAAGGVLEACASPHRTAFCLVRPPGHHASPANAMGFCLLNHVAVAAAYARARHGFERVAIVDYDVHHGNGTQDAFYADAGVLYVSTHEYPFYPGTGAAEEMGEVAGRGFNINVPMPHGSGDAEHRQAFAEIVVPALRRYAPQLILVSAGYDAHFADDIAYQRLSVDGYGALVSMVKDAADELCGGRVVAALEGGYHLTALPWCVRRTIEILGSDVAAADPLGAAEASATPAGFEKTLALVTRLHGL
jgi:acetoin utilization deacetylase AcuC-like enzyme